VSAEHTDNGRRSRSGYADVGRVTRAAVARAIDEGAPTHALRVLLVVVAAVASWSRVEDNISRRAIAHQAGMDERQTRRAIEWLHAHGVIDWRPGGSTPGGRRYLSRVRLLETDTGGGTDHGSERPPVAAQTTGRRDHPWSQEAATGGRTGSRPGVAVTPVPRSTEKKTEKTAAPELPAHQRDLLWDAVMEVCSVDASDVTDNARRAYNKAVGDLRKIDADPDEVRERAAAFRLRWPQASLTPTALARRWPECAPGAVPPHVNRNQAVLARAAAVGG